MTVAVGLAVLVLLGLLGTGVEDQLRPSSIAIPGSESGKAEELLREHFGESTPFVILLQGPPAALDRQGPRLVGALQEDSRVRTLSPWDRGSLEGLRPGPEKALVLGDFGVAESDAVRDAVPELQRTLERTIQPPVRAAQSGYATLSRALQEESVKATERAELLAAPLLILVLLVVFRSVIAAAIPLLFGALTVGACRGVLSIVSDSVAVDGFSLVVCTMMGLALGVDYALLMVSRFREELAATGSPLLAAARTRQSAGRTILYAGMTLLIAMAVILVVMPGTLFLSLAGTAMLVTAISVGVAILLAPPILALLGPNVERWRIGAGGGSTGLMGVVGAALRRPKLAAGLIGAALLVLALPVLGLRTGPPSVEQLPESSVARQDAELMQRAVGPGWDAPFVVVAASERGPITGSADGGVQAVIGPAAAVRRSRALARQGRRMMAGRGELSPARLRRLGGSLRRAEGGVERLRRGVTEGAAGAELLAIGSGRAGVGAERILAGVRRAARGSTGALGGLEKLEAGSRRLADGQYRAALGARSVRDQLSALMPVIRQAGLARARGLRSELQEAAAGDPRLAQAARQAGMVVEALELARDQAQRARASAVRLRTGQVRLVEGAAQLHGGVARLREEAQRLPAGLEELADGVSALGAGLRGLSAGAGALSRNLRAGSQAAAPLQGGVGRAGVRVSSSAQRLSGDLERVRRNSPGLFDSGYFVLSALDGAPAARRAQLGEAVSLASGGQAAQLLVVPRHTFNTPGSEALGGRLRAQAEGVERGWGLRTGVTGGAAELADYTDTVLARVPIAVVAIALVTFLVLVVVLRALPLAALAVALNLLTVAVAFGVLRLLFEVPATWPLGGHSYVDAIGAAGIFGIVFGLSIDYAVFLLGRMREHYEEHGDNAAAIEFGLQRTARVITGAAAIMVAVFVVFAAAPIATVSQLGVGLTVAVLLDATVVRIVLLPALMLWIGDRVWWMPSALRRVLPPARARPA